ncbi:methyltransferase domain-containing protein [Bifidobacterium cuniculi]|uniref:Trans-aconitate methyltransferase n=1 Tax=Bifidobacterium cuniculi TaxID=1688 RepID=A0A087AYB8_9BIFI|nr:methyltransferase domain-containing protein [Bifidobacterium cuniculi]KFI63768.1 trans-aconitate methyltransferase [Bifidobacterium cuniculi]
MSDWDSARYLQFVRQRTQPSIDLARRAHDWIEHPAAAIDLGCGPGNSTQVVQREFPDASVVGVDSSADMLAAARRRCPDMEFLDVDLTGDLTRFDDAFDLVFSNACLQWIPDHAHVLPKVFRMLRPGGVLAVQIPVRNEQVVQQVITETARLPRWRECIVRERAWDGLDIDDYHDILSRMTADFELWQTTYCHRMPGVDAIVEWFSSSGLRPYLDQVPDDVRDDFRADVRNRLAEVFPVRANGEVILRFPRLFMLAKRPLQA